MEQGYGSGHVHGVGGHHRAAGEHEGRLEEAQKWIRTSLNNLS